MVSVLYELDGWRALENGPSRAAPPKESSSASVELPKVEGVDPLFVRCLVESTSRIADHLVE